MSHDSFTYKIFATFCMQLNKLLLFNFINNISCNNVAIYNPCNRCEVNKFHACVKLRLKLLLIVYCSTILVSVDTNHCRRGDTLVVPTQLRVSTTRASSTTEGHRPLSFNTANLSYSCTTRSSCTVDVRFNTIPCDNATRIVVNHLLHLSRINKIIQAFDCSWL
jgi:hypothetical protein